MNTSNNSNDNGVNNASAIANAAQNTASEGSRQAEDLQNVENLIKSHITQIDRLKIEIKNNKEMMDDVFLNDAVYKDHDEKAKQAGKVKSATKTQIMQQPNMLVLSVKLKDQRIQIKELQNAISEYLREFSRITGANEIEGEDGQIMEIVYTARLVKKSSKSK